MKNTPQPKSLAVILLTLVPLLSPAANLTWDATPGTAGAQDGAGLWDTTANNWWTGAANTTWNPTVGDQATFGSANGAAGTVTLGANIVSSNIIFNAASAGNYTIAGGGFTLGLTNRIVTANASATISANVVGTGVTTANSGAQVPIGTLTLSGNNSFAGNLVLGANAPNTTTSLRLASSTAAGTSSIRFNDNGNATSPRLELTGGITVTNAISFFAGRNNVAVGIESFSGANTLTGNITPSPGGSQYPIRVDGASTLTLAGTLTAQTGGPRGFILGGTGNGFFTGTLAGGSASVATIIVNKTGSGSWTYSGANTYTSTHVLSEGTLNLDYSTQNNAKLAANSPLFLAGGTLNLAGGTFTETVSSNNLVAGAATINRTSGTGILRLNAINRRAGGTLNLGAASIAETDTLNVNGILGGYATVGGADWAINSTGAGDGAITAYSSYTDINALGSTIANAATSNVRLNAAGSGGNIALGAATTTINTLAQNTTTAATVDTSAGALRLGATGGVLIPAGRQSLTIGASANSGALTAGGADETPGEIILINNSANELTVNASIIDNGSGAVSVTKSGSGSATLNGSNSHTGTNYIVGGTLTINSAANLGSGSVAINGGTLRAATSLDLSVPVLVGPAAGYGNGTIDVASGQTVNLFGVVSDSAPFLTGVSLAGSLTKTGAGTLVLAGANTYTLGTIINGGTVSISSDGNLGGFTSPSLNGTFTCYRPDNIVLNGGTLEGNGSFTLSANRGIRLGPINGSGSGTIAVPEFQILTFNGQISDNWNGTGSFTKSGPGTLVLGGNVNEYSGSTTVSAGTLQLNNSRALPNGAGKGNVSVSSGASLTFNGINVGLNGLSGAGTVDNVSANAMTLTVGYNDQSSSFGGTIQNSFGGPLALAKAGSGTFTFSGTATYSGSTFVNSGVLALTGAATITSTTNIVVGSAGTLNVTGLTGGTLALSSGQTLSGTGTVLGTIDNASGASVAPGTSAGTLNVANLTLSGGSLNYELANVTTTGAGVNDYLVVSGTLNVSAFTTLNLSYLNGIPAGSGKYTLIAYGSFAGDVNNISVPSGFTINNNTVAKTIELIIDHIPVNLTWVGDGAGNVWDVNTTPNWTAGATFFNGDTANFDNTGSSTPAIFINGPVFPAAVNVSGSQNYNFTGSAIASASLTKSGSGTLTLENDTVFANGGIISGGTLQIGNAGTSGSIAGGNLTNNSALVVNRADDAVITNAISGSGSVTQTGAGTLALSGSNSYAGLTLVSVGRLYPRNGAALGDITSGTVVNSDAQIYMDQNVNFPAEPLTLNGTGLNGAGDGALRKGGGGATTYGGPVTLGSDAVIALDGNATLNLTNTAGISGNANLTLTGGTGSQGLVSGPINLGNGAGILTKAGASTWTLAGANSMSLATIPEGALVLANNNALGTNLNVVLTSIAGGPGLSGTRLTLSGGVSFGATRTLTMPSGGAGAIRSAFFGTGAGLTNSWAGPVTLLGDGDPGNFLAFGADNGSTFVISGNVTADTSFAGRLFLRGNGSGGGSTGTGVIAGTVSLNGTTGAVQVEDGSTWILASAGHTWTTTFFANSSRLILGANNAIPPATAFTIASGANNRIDLNGFNQTLSGLEMGPGLHITNSSSTADAALTYAAPGLTTYGGTISDGARKLNLTISTGSLGLTNPVSLNLTKSTLAIASGAALELNFIGTNTVLALVTNGVSVPAGIYNVLNAAPYIGGVGNILVKPGPSGPATLTNTVSGNTLSLSWPAGEGWRLQAQTNSLTTGFSNNWAYITDGSVSSTNITVNPANPTVFYRLTYP